MIVYAVIDDALSPDFPLGDALEVFIRREDAERYIKEVRGDESELAAKLRVEERELEAGGLNYTPAPHPLTLRSPRERVLRPPELGATCGIGCGGGEST